jgi:hypothetical protein
MKKRYLTVALLCTMLFRAKGQTAADSTQVYEKKLVSKTDVELVYSHYLQDGHNSAVTGGRGTEKLTVYSPSVRIGHTFKEYNTLRFVGGVDAITSASTDRIDFIMSSASRKDARSYGTLNYERRSRKRDLVVGLGSGFSIESDYFSIPVIFTVEYTEPSRQRSYGIGFQANFDDLRWGRINPDYRRPVKLIYPSELRDTIWFDHYRRQSYNLKLSFTQVINRRLVLGIFPEPAYQKGLLSTPFHRVFFRDAKTRVEKLPGERLKLPVGLRANYFLGDIIILKSSYGFYWDNFGIQGNSLELEAAFKTSPKWTLTPGFRFYTQSSSKYFAAYKQHLGTEIFYTSDYDLSAFRSYKAGINLRYIPSVIIFRNTILSETNLRYSYFYRSNGLAAHIITFSMRFDSEKYRLKKRLGVNE